MMKIFCTVYQGLKNYIIVTINNTIPLLELELEGTFYDHLAYGREEVCTEMK